MPLSKTWYRVSRSRGRLVKPPLPPPPPPPNSVCPQEHPVQSVRVQGSIGKAPVLPPNPTPLKQLTLLTVYALRNTLYKVSGSRGRLVKPPYSPRSPNMNLDGSLWAANLAAMYTCLAGISLDIWSVKN